MVKFSLNSNQSNMNCVISKRINSVNMLQPIIKLYWERQFYQMMKHSVIWLKRLFHMNLRKSFIGVIQKVVLVVCQLKYLKVENQRLKSIGAYKLSKIERRFVLFSTFKYNSITKQTKKK